MKYGEVCFHKTSIVFFMAKPAGTPWINLLLMVKTSCGLNHQWGPMYVLSYIESSYACYTLFTKQMHTCTAKKATCYETMHAFNHW